MSVQKTIVTGGPIFDGQSLLVNHTAVFINDICTSVVPNDVHDDDAIRIDLDSDILSIGYADLQVNGGGGVLLNDAPSVVTLNTISNAHRTLGTTCMLPTLITDTPDVTHAAINAVKTVCEQGHETIAGLHLEGPHLSIAKKGAHQAELIRPMQDDDLIALCYAADVLPVLKVTIAPENVTLKQTQALVEAGVVVALGHTDADYQTCMEYVQAGACCVTHVFNAMSQLTSREPGLVGAALDSPELSVGLIADGVHVHSAAIRSVWKMKAKTDQLYLVTDAMAPAGTSLAAFQLNGRTIHRQNGRLTLDNGTLAGADIDITSAIRILCQQVGVELADALRAAVSVPRSVLGTDKHKAVMVGQPMNRIIRIAAELNGVSCLDSSA